MTKKSMIEKTFSVVFGSILIGTGIFAVFQADITLIQSIPLLLITSLFGGNLVLTAFSDKPSWLSSMGPLP